MTEEEFTGPASTGSNRTFLILAGVLALPLLLALIIGAAVILPRLGQQTGTNTNATSTAVAASNSTAVAQAALTQQAALSPTAKASQTATSRPTNTRVQVASPTRIQGSDTPPVVRVSPTLPSTPTRIGGGGNVPTPTRIGGGGLPNGGLSSETGGPLVILAGLGLLAVLVVARRLRSA